MENSEEEIRFKLRKIEALFEGACTSGEKKAASAALDRIREKLSAAKKDSVLEFTFTLRDIWSKRLFAALCRRYSLKPYRYARQRHTTIMVRVEEDFCNNVLWPQYKQLSNELNKYLDKATERIISEEIHQDTSDAQEIKVSSDQKFLGVSEG